MEGLEQQVEARLTAAECAKNAAEAEAGFRDVIKLLHALPLEKLGGRLAYALGYAWYQLPEHVEERAMQIEKSLRYAIARAPDNYYAVLYLGHYFFDTRRYEQALEQFLKIPHHYFAKYDQVWRDLKLVELIVCCFLRTNRPDEAFDALQRLIEESGKASEVDRPVMSELKTTFQQILKT